LKNGCSQASRCWPNIRWSKYLMDKITVLEGLGSFVDATHTLLQKQMELQKPLKQKTHYCYRLKPSLCHLSKK
jgi:hypothetical protein